VALAAGALQPPVGGGMARFADLLRQRIDGTVGQ
jgi:hypothetical protein